MLVPAHRSRDPIELLDDLDMASNSLTRANLAEAVYEQVGLSRQESAALVESLLDHVSDALIEENLVKIASFGTFMVREKNARIGRNPKTGVETTISPRRYWCFGPAKSLRTVLTEPGTAKWKTSPSTIVATIKPHFARPWCLNHNCILTFGNDSRQDERKTGGWRAIASHDDAGRGRGGRNG